MANEASQIRVLLVDDDPLLLEMLHVALASADIESDVAHDGRQALARLGQQRYDLMLTDKKMAGLDGHTLVNEAWLSHPEVGAVMMTGHRSEESFARAQEQRILAYLEKPFGDLDELVETLRQLALEQRKRLGAP